MVSSRCSRSASNATGEESACRILVFRTVFDANFHDGPEAFVGMPEHVRLVPTQVLTRSSGLEPLSGGADAAEPPSPGFHRHHRPDERFVLDSGVWTTISGASSGGTC